MAWWYGPAGMPAAKVNALNAAVNEALTSAAMLEVIFKNGLEPMRMTPDRYATAVGENHTFWGQVVKATGVAPED